MRRRRTATILLTAGIALAVATVPLVSPAGAQPSQVSPSTARLAAPDDRGDRGAFAARPSLRAPVTDENFYFVMADRFENGSTANDTGGIPGDRLQHGFDPTNKGFYNGGDLEGSVGPDRIHPWPRHHLDLAHPQLQEQGGATRGRPVGGLPRVLDHRLHSDRPAPGHQRRVARAGRRRSPARDEGLLRHHHQPHRGRDRLRAQTGRAPHTSRRTWSRTARLPVGPSTTEIMRARTASRRSTRRCRSRTRRSSSRARQNLKVPTWLNDITLYHNRGNTTFTGEDSDYGDFFGLDDLFTEHPRVLNGMIDIYKTWIREMGIDGFRIDTMKHVNDEFWQKFGPEVLNYARSQGKREFFMFGEVYDTTKSVHVAVHDAEPDAGRARLPLPGRGPQLRVEESAGQSAAAPSSATTTGTPTRTPTSTSCRHFSVITTWAGSVTSSARTTPALRRRR